MAKERPFKLSERWPKQRRISVDPIAIARIEELCRDARFYDAWQVAEPLGPLQSWSAVDARLAGATLAEYTGGSRLSDLLDYSCFREQPQNPRAQYSFLATLRVRRGPLAAWRILRGLDLESHPPREKARLLGLKAWIALSFRDFDAADGWLRRAREAWPDAAWNLTMRAGWLDAQDRTKEALEAAQGSLAARPWYRPALIRIAECLKDLNREAEAVVLLNSAIEHLQDAQLVGILISIQREQEDFAGMLAPLELYAKWSPLKERPTSRWLLGQKAEALYRCERYEEAAACAAEIGTEFQTEFAKRLRLREEPRRRVRLAVGFFRQRHNTCAPATLAALASFWGVPVLEREIADEICYDGTYDLHERRWSEDAGCFVREFRVTWESTKALIDRGLPFAMVTAAPTSSHLQAVIGYDEMRNVLLIREPSDRVYCEFTVEKFFQDYAAIGPRGMVIVPEAKRAVLEGIDLPEADLYDLLYGLNTALEVHDRARALALCENIETLAPGHRLGLIARRMLADYDRNVPNQLAAVEGLLGLFPSDERLELTRVYCLRDLARRDVRVQLLESISRKEDVHPVFWKELATELAEDARQHNVALHWLSRAHRAVPWLASVVAKIADIYWDQRKIEESIELYRFAFCADDKNEGRARSYFIASRHVRKAGEALDFLRRRFAEFGKKSGDPARTLFNALDDVDRVEEGLQMLEEAIKLRPGDGMLMLFAADQFARYNRQERTAELVAAAESISKTAAWLRTSARLAVNRLEPAKAIECWKKVIELEPVAEDAHGALARLLEQTEGSGSALDHLHKTCERFPHNIELNKLWLARLREKNDAEAEPVARRLVEINPANAWARRELASILLTVGKLDDALAEAETARRLNPGSSYGHSMVGAIERKRGQFSVARDALREAIRLDVDNTFAIQNLIALASGAESRRQELAFVRGELIRQVVFGEGLLTYREQAQGILNSDELLAELEAALEARPDLWHAWSAVTKQLRSCSRLDEALKQANELTRRFPLAAGSWRVLGEICELRYDWPGAITAYEQALLVNPNWSDVACDLSEAYEHGGDRTAARRALEHALTRDPMDERLHGYLASLLWKLREKDAALEHLRQAVKLNPSYGWAWDQLREWGQAGEALQMARELTILRGGEARSWFILAENLPEDGHSEEQLQAIEAALKLNPQFTDAYDKKAELLTSEERFDEAIAACNAPVWQGHPPTSLRGRAAWIEAKRGNRAEAIRQMRAVVADDESYSWGWQRLSDWLEEEGDYPNALLAAEKLAHWRPKGAFSYGYRGAAKLNVGDRYGAINDLEKALTLDSTYSYAGWTLFDLQLEDDDFVAASKTLDLLREHAAVGRVYTAEVKLALRRGSIGAAVTSFSKLAGIEEVKTDVFEELLKEFTGADALGEMDRTLGELLKQRGLSRAAAALWAQRETAKNNWNLLPKIVKFIDREPMARGALEGWFNAAGDARHRLPRSARLFAEHSHWIRRNLYTWGILGYALRRAGQNQKAADWLCDWREQKGCEPWMLTNLMFALRALGRTADAGEVCRWIIAQSESAQVTATFRCFYAVDEAIADRLPEAASVLEPIRGRELKSAEQLLAHCVESIRKVESANGLERRSIYDQEIASLRTAAAKVTDPEPALVATCRRVTIKMASQVGTLCGWRAKLFAGNGIFAR